MIRERNNFEAEIVCEACAHVWVEVAFYVGHGDYCFTDNEDLACPECGKSNPNPD